MAEKIDLDALELHNQSWPLPYDKAAALIAYARELERASQVGSGEVTISVNAAYEGFRANRERERSKFQPGIARALAEQWGPFIEANRSGNLQIAA